MPTATKKLRAIAIAAGGSHTVALREDGTEPSGACDVEKLLED